jgi:hypothetical protein
MKVRGIAMKFIQGLKRQKDGDGERSRKGQGLVEFALILPVLLTAFFVIIELARLYHAWSAVENGARFGIRYAITGEFDSSNCSGPCDDESEEETARIATVKDVTWAGSETIIRLDEGTGSQTDQGFFNITVCQPDNLVGPATTFDTYDCNPAEDAGDPGEKVAVVVEFNHPVLVPIISNIVSEIRLTAQREATVETFREVKSDSAPGYSPPPPAPSYTPPPTATPLPTEAAAYDYCANILYYGDNHPNDSEHSADSDVIFWDQSNEYDKMWKFAFEIYNNNDVSMYLSDYFVTWTGNVDLLYARYGSSCPPSWCSHKMSNKGRTGPVYCYTSASSPKRHCNPNANVEFLSRPGYPSDPYPQELYNMFCKDYNLCSYNEPWSTSTNLVMTGTSYTFHAEATFTFRAADTGEAADIDCFKEWDASGNAPDHCVGGCSGGGYTPPDTPEAPGGGGGGGGGGTSTPDPSPPGD